MPRTNSIKWRKSDQEKLAKTVKTYNAKIARKAKKTPEAASFLPTKVNVKDIKKSISTRNDFNKIIARLERVKKKDAFDLIQTSSGNIITKYEKREVAYAIREINRKRAALRKQANVSTEKGTMGAVRSMNINPKKNNYQSIRKSKWRLFVENVERQATDKYYEEKNELYKENYIKGLKTVFGEKTPLIGKIRMLSAKKLVELYYEEPDMQLEFLYSSEDARVKELVITEIVDEVLKEQGSLKEDQEKDDSE